MSPDVCTTCGYATNDSSEICNDSDTCPRNIPLEPFDYASLERTIILSMSTMPYKVPERHSAGRWSLTGRTVPSMSLEFRKLPQMTSEEAADLVARWRVAYSDVFSKLIDKDDK